MSINPQSTLFQIFRPICVKVAREPSVANLKQLQEDIQHLEKNAIGHAALLEYLIFPLNLTIKKNNVLNEEQQILCYQCIRIIFEKCAEMLITEERIIWTYNAVSLYFSVTDMKNKQAVNKVGKVPSEEQNFAVIELLEVVSGYSTDFCNQKIFSDNKNLALIGHLVSVLLDIIEKEKLIKLQVSAAKSLGNLAGIKSRCIINKHDLYGAVFASFLPGITMKMKTCLTRNNHHSVTVSSLNTFSHIVASVMFDINEPTTYDDVKDLFSLKDSSETILNRASFSETNKESLKVVKTDQWLQQTCKNITFVLKDILNVLVCNDHLKVQLALIDFVDNIFSNCMKNLSSCIAGFLDVLVKGLYHDVEEIKSRSLKILVKVNDIFNRKEGPSNLKSIVSEKLYSLVLALPRLMNTVNEDIKLKNVQILHGYLMFYGNSILHVLNTTATLEKMLTAILQILTLESKDISLIEECSFSTNYALPADGSQRNCYRKRFYFFTNIKIFTVLQDVINCLVVHADINLLVDYLLDRCVSDGNIQKQAVIILNEIIHALSNKADDDLENIVQMILSVYLDEQLFCVPVNQPNYLNQNKEEIDSEYVQNNFPKALSMPVEMLNSNIQLICLILEGLSNMAKILKNDLSPYLIQVLYPVIEKVGSQNMRIHQTALKTLDTVAVACGFENITTLLMNNSDYLVNSITLEFRHLHVASTAPSVLCVILKFCTKEMLITIADIIEDVLTALDTYQDEVAAQMLNVLKYFAVAVSQCYDSGVSKTKGSKVGVSKKKRLDPSDVYDNDVSVSQFLISYCKIFQSARGDVYEEEVVDDMKETEDYNDSEETEEKIPLHFQLVIKGAERCVNYIPTKCSSIKLAALEVVKHSVTALKERENDLLPLLHKLWPAVIKELKTTNPVIVMNTLDVVSLMIEHSGDFLRKRISDEFLQQTTSFLHQHHKTFTKEKSAYEQLNKVLQKLIQFLGNTLPDLNVKDELFCKVVSVCILFLDCRLHRSIQEVALSSMRKFLDFKYDTTWLLLQSCFQYGITDAPNKSFKKLAFLEDSKRKNNLSENILKLLQVG